ncbi:hypothetical protein K3495_g15813 [Podosphaera aphanis]|nr:hypothetical protein K3495_g15813 [Podosphaera aphanis]
MLIHYYECSKFNAFIHAEIDKEIYVEQPHGFANGQTTNKHIPKHDQNQKQKKIQLNQDKKYCRLNKALYGLKQSSRLWYEHLLGILNNFGFSTMPYDNAIFINSIQKIIIICHVDDLIFTGPNQKEINNLVQQISKHIKIETIGNINQFLGMQITTEYENQKIQLNQNKYTANLLERFQKNKMNPVTSPVELGINLEKSTHTASNEDNNLYQQQVGSLIYLVLCY